MPIGLTRAAVLGAVLLAACNQPPTPGLARGETLYNSCAKCHGESGEGSQRLRAPAIAGLPQWYVESQLVKFAASHRGYDAFDTTGIMMKSVAWILDREGDVPSVAQYVASMPQPRTQAVLHGNAQAGAARATRRCMRRRSPAAATGTCWRSSRSSRAASAARGPRIPGARPCGRRP